MDLVTQRDLVEFHGSFEFIGGPTTDLTGHDSQTLIHRLSRPTLLTK